MGRTGHSHLDMIQELNELENIGEQDSIDSISKDRTISDKAKSPVNRNSKILEENVAVDFPYNASDDLNGDGIIDFKESMVKVEKIKDKIKVKRETLNQEEIRKGYL